MLAAVLPPNPTTMYFCVHIKNGWYVVCAARQGTWQPVKKTSSSSTVERGWRHYYYIECHKVVASTLKPDGLWSTATSATQVHGFSYCPDLSHVVFCSRLLQGHWRAIRGLCALPEEHSKLSADESLESVCFKFLICGGISQQEGSGVFLSMGHNGFSPPMKHYSGWQAGTPATWESFPQHPLPS